jgi:hypothetical protein
MEVASGLHPSSELAWLYLQLRCYRDDTVSICQQIDWSRQGGLRQQSIQKGAEAVDSVVVEAAELHRTVS